MNSATDKIQKLFEKYHFVEPITPDIRELIVEKSKPNLINIIKSSGDYSFLYGKTLSVYYKVRQLGYRISFSGAKVVLAAISTLIISASVIGGYFIYSLIQPEKVKIINKIEIPAKKIKEKREKVSKNRGEMGQVQFEVQIFDSPNQDIGNKISQIITANLKESLGPNNVALVNKDKKSIALNMIMGNIKNFEDFDVITAKVVDVRTGKIEYVINKTIYTKDELENACKGIARKIYLEIKK